MGAFFVGMVVGAVVAVIALALLGAAREDNGDE